MAIWAIAVLYLALLIITLLAVIAARTAVFKSKQIHVPAVVIYPLY
jgi:hypothetical protein